MTETSPRQRIESGALMLATSSDNGTDTTVIVEVVEHVDDSSVRVVTLDGAVVYHHPHELAPPPDTPGAAELVRAGLRRALETTIVLSGEIQQTRRQYLSFQEQCATLEEKIAAMRRYAIDAHRRDDICRDGLDEFLRVHGLQSYRPRFRGTVRIEFDVEIDAYDADSAADTLHDEITTDVATDVGIRILDTDRTVDTLDENTDRY